MNVRFLFPVLGVCLCLGSAAGAANIILVTETRDVDANGTQDDLGLEEFLKGLGHQVDVRRGNWTTLDAAKVAALNAADLVVVSRSTSSGSYDDSAAEIADWNGLTAPMLSVVAYLARGTSSGYRWYWLNSSATSNLVAPKMQVLEPTHPIFRGVPLEASNQVEVSDGTIGTGQTTFNATLDVGNGKLLAQTATGNCAWIVEWEPGIPYYAGSPGTPGSKRILYSSGTQESGATPWGAFNLKENGRKILVNAINYLLGVSTVSGLATEPTPALAQTDVPRDIVLSWTAGEFARTHDVYVGLSAADVNNAGRANPLGVLASRGQSDNSYAPADLQFGQTYYWRVDEVNAPPGSAVLKGEIWSFTVEPLAYPIANVTATASSAQPDMGPENTVNGSGLDKSDQHSTEPKQMWISAGVPPNWIQFAFDKACKLHELWVWNSNQVIESFVGFGAKEVRIEYSIDGATWTPLPNVPQFAQATGAPTYTHNTTINLGGVLAQYVKLTVISTWGGLPQSGLSEVRFFQIPVQAREPQPADGATGVDLDVTLNWRPGREAASHKVSFGTDANAVAQGTAPAVTLSEHSYSPASLQFGTTYYWRVDELGGAVVPETQAGPVWSFTAREYAVVEDFESYTDDLDAGEAIFQTWIDGFTNGLSGSTVGNFTAPFAEQTIVHGGKQSMPFEYNNVKTPYFSEAQRTFAQPQDWTGSGADTLVVYFQGQAVSFFERVPGEIALGGGGADIWNAADQFRFAFKRLDGNGSIVAKVESIGNTDPWAKGGVMIRESLDPGSRFAAVYATPGNGVRYQARLLMAGAATSDTSVATPDQIALKTPVWIKIERTGPNFRSFYSSDGVTWTAMSWNPQSINMAGTVYLGLAVTSHNVNAATTAQFSNVTTTGGVTGAWTVGAIGAAQPANDPAPLYLTVQDSAGKSRTVTHPDPAATTLSAWQQWRIPLSDLTGVNVAAVKKLSLGVGDRSSPKAGGAGLLYIDDIGFGHPVSAN